MFFQLNPRSLKIDLAKGCYSFDNESALGKTYLFKLLALVGDYGMADNCCITFREGQTEKEIVAKLTGKEYNYIFLDRFDLYATDEICKVVEELRKKSVVFLDIKNLKKVKYCFPEFVDIKIMEDIVEVY